MNQPFTAYRPTVAGLVVRPVNPVSSPYPPVLLQWPTRAAQKGEGNLATVQGGVEGHDTDLLSAMKRELWEEHRLNPRHARVMPLDHRAFRSPETMKEYIWFLIVCENPVALVPDPSEVEAASWYYCPQMLFHGIQQMNKGKARMFKEVFLMACEQYPEYFGEYQRYVARFRKRQRQQLARRLPRREAHVSLA